MADGVQGLPSRKDCRSLTALDMAPDAGLFRPASKRPFSTLIVALAGAVILIVIKKPPAPENGASRLGRSVAADRAGA